MLDLWNSLDVFSQIFYCIAIPATVLLLIQTIMMFIGFGEEGSDSDGLFDTDGADGADVDLDDGIFGSNTVTEMNDDFGLEGLRIFTVRGLIAFFVVFGWVGVVMRSSGANIALTVIVAAFCGFAMMVALAYLMKAVMSLRSDGNADNRNAIGTSGKVQLTIPPSRSGEGKVHIMLQGTYVERNAVTDSDVAIPTGAEVVVTGVSGQTDLIVRKK